MTAIAVERSQKGQRILSNYQINVPNATLITPYDLVRLLDRGRAEETTTICLQEVYGWLDSHISLSKLNRFESYFVFQAEKLNYDIVWDSQIAMRVDSSLRKMSAIRFDCVKVKEKGFLYWVLDQKHTDVDIRTKRFKFMPFGEAEKLFPMYDTTKGCKPIGYNEMIMEMENLEPILKNATIDRQVKLIEALKLPPRFINKISIDDILTQLEEPTVFSAYVTNRLKLKSQGIELQLAKKVPVED